ncbi:MAG: hypothetical protein HZB44_02660 [Actinobacteria bacterium]|nr:hypothetical protein [Actinomycetota bacterium]
MAKFSRLLFGGIVGAGLAYLFSRKDVRRRLMGGGQGQLPAPGAPRTNIPVTVPTPMAAPVEAPAEAPAGAPAAAPAEEPVSESPESEEPVTSAIVAEDLEAQIEETRRQVEEHLEKPFAAPEPAVPGTAISEEEVDTGEAPEILLEEEVISDTQATREELEEAEAEALTEAVETNGIEIPAKEESAVLEAEKTAGLEAGVKPELEAEKTVQFETQAVPETDEFADLKTPVAGEPTTTGQEAGEAVLETETGPAPSQIDRDEMRRRIDETRARLKAKAFDALVSGETFIEPEPEAGREKHEAAGVEIDSEIEEQIDRSLKEEE